MRGFPDLSFAIEEAIVTALRSSSLVDDYLSGDARRIRQVNTFSEKQERSIEIRHADDEVTELEMPTTLSFRLFAESRTVLRAMRQVLLGVIHSDYHFTIGALDVWTEYGGTIIEADPEAGTAEMFIAIVCHPYREYAP